MPRALATRRRLVASGLQLLAALTLPARFGRAETENLRLGDPRPFSFDWLVEHARALARRDYVPPPRPAPEIVDQIDYDAHGKLRTRPDYALWGRSGGVYPITYVHKGRFFPKTVRLHLVDGAEAREILYDRAYFTIPEDHVAAKLPPDASAFAGFWIQESRREGTWWKREPWVTFSGASYFRAVGELGQVGLSARGIAVDVAHPDGRPEEFPDFTHFWFEPCPREGDPQIVYALLDGPSLAGAYRFAMHRTRAVIMDIECRLFLRRDIDRLGIAPLTSMFWFAEYPSRDRFDWRPEVHDSDCLVIWNGAGERLVRPLNNPPRTIASSFFDDNPRGYGLAQRDRNYDHYLDGVNYHHRPTGWVEPKGEWGRGVVQLIEIPTNDEIHDNVVAYWLSERPARAGDALAYAYRLHWVEFDPFFPIVDFARVVATRMSRGGIPGQPRPPGIVKFWIEFDGAILGTIPWGVRPEVVVWASRGEVSMRRSEPVWHTPRWFGTFDLSVEGRDPIELRAFLALDGKPISETWLFQLHPEILPPLGP
ncbi:MAG: glucan biosynthesis protein D [Geminicoccaceae bacterium]|jgi:glucans biosynthesis protein|nr:MAG: glucan biosynthesis protein D [Geminicoccaceae bacterium]